VELQAPINQTVAFVNSGIVAAETEFLLNHMSYHTSLPLEHSFHG